MIADAAGIGTALERGWEQVGLRYESRRHDLQPLVRRPELYLEPAEVLSHRDLAAGRARDLQGRDRPMPPELRNFPTAAPRELRLDARAERPLAPLQELLAGYPGRVLIAADSPGRREVLGELLHGAGLRARPCEGWTAFAAGDARLALTVAPEIAGLSLLEPQLLVLSESQLFGNRARQERRRRRSAVDPGAILRDLQSLAAGAPVVHEQYGVGRYVGLQIMEVGGQSGEFLVLEYQDGDRLYVPVHSLHLVSRYTGAAPESAPLHKLGSDQWSRARRRAAEQVRDVAAELLDLYARRKARKGLKLPLRELEYQAFANAFPFEETADQAEAIQKVLADLDSEQPMDRIVCGDVGFGKTEVAMRAAFAAVQAGKQVAVLVPTTLLAQQHYNNFRDRFADWPVRIESLSRFRTGKESNAVVEGLERGTVDIVIATHRLMHAHVRFKDLGLVVIDEEHRFGVRDKEQLKALRSEVHVLTLTATPIPRTLNMALGGLRELSLIATPPAERLAIKTFVVEWNDATLREACLRELRRGGQLYFVHNEIRDIEKIAGELGKLVPEARIRVGHGQMRERELEQLMVDFYHRRFDMLVCTTIIESSIDNADREYDPHQPRRPLRPRPAAPAARPRRPLAPPRLCLPDRAGAARPGPGCPEAPRGAGVARGTRRGLRARDPRPRDPRRGRAARRAAERRADRGRPVALPGHARSRRARTEGRARAGARRAVRVADRGRDARAGAAARGLRRRRARAARTLQADRRGCRRRGARRAHRGTRRSLRRAAGAGAEPAALRAAAPARPPARHPPAGLRRPRRRAAVRAAELDRPARGVR
ncbi:MAG: CarD family transcriptional regulator [Steroidobacteraceae bacterium]